MGIDGYDANYYDHPPIGGFERHVSVSKLALAKSILKASPNLAVQACSYLAQEALAHTLGAGIKRVVLGKQPK